MKFLQFKGGLDAGPEVDSIVNVDEIISISNTYNLKGVTTIQLKSKENVYSTEESKVLIDRLHELLNSNNILSRKKPEPYSVPGREVNTGAFNAIGYDGFFARYDRSNIEQLQWESFRMELNEWAELKGFYYIGLTKMMVKNEDQ